MHSFGNEMVFIERKGRGGDTEALAPRKGSASVCCIAVVTAFGTVSSPAGLSRYVA
jgi:hypothetical protein